MRVGLWALLAVLLGAFVAHFVLEDRGYVLVNFRGYVVEMSVPGARADARRAVPRGARRRDARAAAALAARQRVVAAPRAARRRAISAAGSCI